MENDKAGKIPKFGLGQQVIRIVDDKKGKILEIIKSSSPSLDDYFYYLLKYDEGEGEGNDGTGYWSENCLSN